MNNDTVSKHNKSFFDIFVKVSIIVIAAGSLLAAIKCIFVGIQRDEEYALTMSYRLLIGDKLLAQVWDPHQTSAFLLSAIEWIFIRLTGDTTYLVLWCKTIGTIIHAIIAFFLYRTLHLYAPKYISFLLCLIYFGILPKDGIIPEFSIMMAWFVTLIVIMLARMHYHRESTKKVIFDCILLAVISFCLILSYPTTVIIIPLIFSFLIIDRKKNPKTVLLLYPIILFVLGLSYLGYLLSYLSVTEIYINVKEALKACGSHNYEEMSKSALMLTSIIALVVISIIAGIVSFVVAIIGKIISIKRKAENYEFFTIACLVAIIFGSFAQIFFCVFRVFEYMYSYELAYYFWIYFFAIVILFKNRKEKINSLLLRFELINILGFISVITLTNLTIFTSVPYCISGLVVSLLALFLYADRKSEKLKKLVIIMLLTVAFSNNFFKGFSYSSNDGYNWNIMSANKLIHSGAAKGIITEYMTGYINEKTQDDWDRYIQDGDNVLVWDITSTYYFNKKVNIASYTTISTPTYYVDSLKKYWEENPEKYPDVIAVAVWFGSDYRMKDYDNFLEWIENEYDADEVIEEDYYRYYIRRR